MARETVWVLCDNGAVMAHDLPLPSGIADRVGRGQLRLVNEDGTEITAEPSVAAPAAPQRPADSALKTEWVAYAVAVDGDLSAEDAESMTKADLIEMYGAK